MTVQFTGRADLVALAQNTPNSAHYSVQRGAVNHDELLRQLSIGMALIVGDRAGQPFRLQWICGNCGAPTDGIYCSKECADAYANE